ncbi:protein of unknown function [Burkholderia multivorans]
MMSTLIFILSRPGMHEGARFVGTHLGASAPPRGVNGGLPGPPTGRLFALLSTLMQYEPILEIPMAPSLPRPT